jgi:DNA-3-methyladenine glycosylase
MAHVIEPEAIAAMRTVPAARWLLGKFLVCRRPDGEVDARMITEVEAYDGEADLACHARAGRTARTAPLYEAGGIWYVYLCYGIHEMLNLVVGPRDCPAAILIRGVVGLHGPGRVTKTLGIDRRLNKTPATPETGLWLEDRGVKLPRSRIQATARIGVEYAGAIWSKKPWRFVVTG